MTCGAVIPAAGRARRFGSADKILIEIAGRPLLAWTIDALLSAHILTEIVIAVNNDNQLAITRVISQLNTDVPVTIAQGGDARMDSVRAGVNALSAECDCVLIHDAARPLVSPALIRASVETGALHGAVIAVVPVTDTIKRVRGDSVLETVDRNELAAVQTPQVFHRTWLLDAYEQWPSEQDATDEASILEAAGCQVRTIPGDPENVKVTTATDASVAEALLQRRGGSR